MKNLGLYSETLTGICSCYPKDRVRVYLYDDIQEDPQTFLDDLFSFLGVSGFTPPSIGERYNQVRYMALQSLVNSVGLGRALDAFKTTRVGRWLKRAHGVRLSSRTGHQTLNDDDRILKQFYRDDILRLQELIHRDLSHWL